MKDKKCIVKHPIGDFTVTLSPNGVRELVFGDPPKEVVGNKHGLKVLGRGALDSRERHHLDQLTGELTRYFNGEKIDFEVETDLAGYTDFQRRVWKVSRQIPPGETRSYGWVAEQCGSPRGGRAVGQALKRNPIVIVIPCHRVISSDGGLGGFSGGLEWKRFLQEWERST